MRPRIALRNDGCHIHIAHGRIDGIAMSLLDHGRAVLRIKGLEVKRHRITHIGHADVEKLLEVVITGRWHVLILPVPGGRVHHGHRGARRVAGAALRDTAARL